MFEVHASGGIAGIAEVGRGLPPSGVGRIKEHLALDRPSTWAMLYTGGAVLILVAFYFGFGGLKGDVAS